MMMEKGGPRTKQGKEVSSKNSLKHGVTSKSFLNEQESETYSLIAQDLINDYEPAGAIEKIIVSDLAMIRIQLNRFRSAECALFKTSQNEISDEEQYSFLTPKRNDFLDPSITIDAIMPPKSELDRLYRYRTALENQFTKKLSQLIQLQEMRAKRDRIASRS
jgi:hypothetical protein